MRNSLNRKPSPLSVWRAQYNYVSSQIRKTKDANKSGSKAVANLECFINLEVGGGYTPAQIELFLRLIRLVKDNATNQRNVIYLRKEARRLMGTRASARDLARAMWQSNQRGSI
jgi:hypothetical protein